MHNTCSTQKWDELKVIIGKCAFQWKGGQAETSWRRRAGEFSCGNARKQVLRCDRVNNIWLFCLPRNPWTIREAACWSSPVNWVTPRERISTRSSQIMLRLNGLISPEELKRWECFTNTFVTFKSRQHYFYFSFTKVAFVWKKKKYSKIVKCYYNFR